MAALALLLIFVSAAFAPVGAEPLDLPDLILLLEGGVPEGALLRLVERWGLRRELHPGDWVALKRAGAPDSLLENLAVTPAVESAPVWTHPLPGGTGVLLTNLDEEGRRMGGDLREPAPPNQVQSAAVVATEPTESPEAWTIQGNSSAPYFDESWEGERWGTPGGYTRYKLYYSRAPYDGFRTLVPPIVWLVRGPILVTGWAGGFAPPLIP